LPSLFQSFWRYFGSKKSPALLLLKSVRTLVKKVKIIKALPIPNQNLKGLQEH
jgi:hypothetical protein